MLRLSSGLGSHGQKTVPCPHRSGIAGKTQARSSSPGNMGLHSIHSIQRVDASNTPSVSFPRRVLHLVIPSLSSGAVWKSQTSSPRSLNLSLSSHSFNLFTFACGSVQPHPLVSPIPLLVACLHSPSSMTAYPFQLEASGAEPSRSGTCHCLIRAVSPQYPIFTIRGHHVRQVVIRQLPPAVRGA